MDKEKIRNFLDVAVIVMILVVCIVLLIFIFVVMTEGGQCVINPFGYALENSGYENACDFAYSKCVIS